jgi:hypothetical protein
VSADAHAGHVAATPVAVQTLGERGQASDDVVEDEEGDLDEDLAPGDERDEPKGHVFPALRILKDAVDRSKMHPVKVIRLEDRDRGHLRSNGKAPRRHP